MNASGNKDQQANWNGAAGRAWVDGQELLDRLFAPFERLLADAVAAEGARRVLDIGCGTGATTMAAARRVGGSGRCVGVDISAPMIALARTRAAAARAAADFIVADAQTRDFDAGAFDMIVSRFGVMFFADPVAAFANLRRAAAPGAALRCLTWRSMADNPFMTAAERAAAPYLPAMPKREPGAPGQFAFADPQRMRRILEDSGWTGIDIQPADAACAMSEADLMEYLMRMGPAGLALQDAPATLRAEAIAAMRAAFDPYIEDGEARFTAACWSVAARA